MGLPSSYFKLLGKIISNNFDLANEFGSSVKYEGNKQLAIERSTVGFSMPVTILKYH